MTKKEIAARWVLRGLVRLARTRLRTTAEFINAHQIVGVGFGDDEGLTWAARTRRYDAFQLAAMLRGGYGLLSAKAAKSQVAEYAPSNKALPRKEQEPARKVMVQMVKLGPDPREERRPISSSPQDISRLQLPGSQAGLKPKLPPNPTGTPSF